MVEQTQWEYRVKTIGSMWMGTKDEQIEATLNDWGRRRLGGHLRVYAEQQRQGDAGCQAFVDGRDAAAALNAGIWRMR